MPRAMKELLPIPLSRTFALDNSPARAILAAAGEARRELAMRRIFGTIWGIRLIPEEQRLDLSHYPEEFTEFAQALSSEPTSSQAGGCKRNK